MNSLPSTLFPTNPKMVVQQRMPWSPIDVGLFCAGEPDRASDSPLDLSLKTRKRCADTTEGSDDDVVFIDQRPAKKRTCYNGKRVSTEMMVCPGQFNNWQRKGDEVSNYGNFKQNLSQGMDDRRHTRTVPSYGSGNFGCVRSKNIYDAERTTAQKHPLAASSMVVQGQASYLPAINNPSVSMSTEPTSRFSSKFTRPRQHPTSCTTQQTDRQTDRQCGQTVSSQPSFCPRQSGLTANRFAQSNKTGIFNSPTPLGRDKYWTHLPSPPTSLEIFDCMKTRMNQQDSELRAALSSSGRFYPTCSSSTCFSSVSRMASSQRCSPDSTLPSPSPSHKANALHPEPGGGSIVECYNAQMDQRSPHCDKARQSSKTSTNCLSPSVSPKQFQKPVLIDLVADGGSSVAPVCYNLHSENTYLKVHDNNAKPKENIAQDTPCVSLPLDPNAFKEQSVVRRSEVESLKRHPKLRCKKHIILSAFQQSENNAEGNGKPTIEGSEKPPGVLELPRSLGSPNAEGDEKPPGMLELPSSHRIPNAEGSGKPTGVPERPHSPRMPTLSPQQHFPPVLPSFVSEPPPLEPTPQVRGHEEPDALSITVVPDASSGASVTTGDKHSSATVSQTSHISRKSNTVNGYIANNLPNIANLSAFVETGKAPSTALNPELCQYKKIWNNNEKGNSTYSPSCSKIGCAPEENEKSFVCTKIVPLENFENIAAHRATAENTSDTPKTIKSSFSAKDGDLQAEIKAYKTSLRMPAKLISRLHVPVSHDSGIAEKFGASEDRFRHIDVFSDRPKADCLGITNRIFETDSLNSHGLSEQKERTAENSFHERKYQENDGQPAKVCCSTHEEKRKARLLSQFEQKSTGTRSQNLQEKGRAPCLESSDQRHKRHRRSMLDEIANSDGFVGEQASEKKSEQLDLFSDPSLLSREERALQRALVQFTKLESGLYQKPTRQRKPTSNTQEKARQLKKKAMRPSPKSKDMAKRQMERMAGKKKGFVDFQPEVLAARTRTQTKGIHCVGGYNRDAAYENELMNDDRRRELKRARRRARQMSDRRATARKIRREQFVDRNESNVINLETRPARRKSSSRAPEETVSQPSAKIVEQNLVRGRIASPARRKAGESLNCLNEPPDLLEEVNSEETTGCWKVRGLASCDSLRQNLRSGRKKGGLLMKLSWRPSTAANKGKPRIAHARVLRSREQGPRSVRMIRLRRRAKLAYQGANNPRETLQCLNSADRTRESRQLSKGRRKHPERVLRKTKNKLRNCPLTRARRRAPAPKALNSRKPNAILQHKNARKYRIPVRRQRRYPLRGLALGEDDEEGYTTEEYEYAPDESCVEENVEAWKKSSIRFLEPPNQPKISRDHHTSSETPLHRAARLGYEEVALHWLRTKSFDVNSQDNWGFTPLHEGCRAGHVSIVRHLLSYGADPNCSSLSGYRPIQLAAENSHVDIVRVLMVYEADLLSDEQCDWPTPISAFIKAHLNDVNGYRRQDEEVSWQLHGSFVTESASGVQHDLFANLPSDEEDEDHDVMFDVSDTEQFVSYRLKVPEANREDNYVVLSDVLESCQMTRLAFLVELGSQIRIFSLSLTTLEEEIAHSSTICARLSDSAKTKQTIELIRLSDLPILVSHLAKPSAEDDVCSEKYVRNKNILKSGSCSVNWRMFEEQNQDSSTHTSPQYNQGEFMLRKSKTSPNSHGCLGRFLITSDTKNKLRKSLTSTGNTKSSWTGLERCVGEVNPISSDPHSRPVIEQGNDLLHTTGYTLGTNMDNSVTRIHSSDLCDQFSMDIKNNNMKVYVPGGDISCYPDNKTGDISHCPGNKTGDFVGPLYDPVSVVSGHGQTN